MGISGYGGIDGHEPICAWMSMWVWMSRECMNGYGPMWAWVRMGVWMSMACMDG